MDLLLWGNLVYGYVNVYLILSGVNKVNSELIRYN